MTSARWRKIETLYHAAREQATERRADFLTRMCADDGDLRRLVEQRLAAEGSKSSKTETDDGSTATSEPRTTVATAPGQFLGPYRIESPLGSGGMGTVYRATDSRLGRPVALKIIRPARGVSPRDALRLFREARAASALNHPNVVTIFDVGMDGDASYIVMELVEGQTLEEILNVRRLSPERILKLALQIADALASTHGKDIVHRDLKPANVMVTRDEQVKLLDFGLAKVSALDDALHPGQTGAADVLTTRAGAVVGTRAYMAPEQARGEATDFRADQYSFGAVLYEMATGGRAFAGTKETDAGTSPVARRVEALTRVNPELPLPLQWVIERCLAEDPGARYSRTRELHADLAGIDKRLGRRASDAAATPHNLPAPRTAMIGRDTELGTVMQLIVKGHARLVTLTGPGGIGKTRLLIALGRELLAEFAGGVFFAPLDRIRDPELVIPSIAAALDVHDTAGRPVLSVLEEHLRRDLAPTLLLIDNFEHVLSAAPAVADLLSASEELTLLITSRAALRVYGEYEIVVPPLHVPNRGAVDADVAQSAAVQLFVTRAPAVARGQPLGHDALRTIAEICTCLDGLPLAIELAAARTRTLSLPALLERVREPLKLLSCGPRDLPARQRTLEATLEWSYRLLTESQRKLFRRLGVFVGGATLEAIEAVCNVDEDLEVGLAEAAESLVDSSLLRPMETESGEGRFAMLETMREYALARLAEAGEEPRTRRAHAAYFRVLADESSYAATEREREALYDRYEQELGNLRAALDWLTACGDADWGLRLAYGLGPYWHERGRAAEGYQRLLRLLAVEGASEELRAWALASAGDLAKHCGNRQQARRHHAECLALGRRLDSVALVIRALNALSVMTQHDGDLEQSRAHHQEVISVARMASAPPALLAGLVSNHAGLALLEGDHDLAQRLQEEIMELCRDSGDESGLAWCVNHQGDIARSRGDLGRARLLYEDALARFRALEERLGIAGCQYDLARVIGQLGDHESAESLLQQALTLYWELDHKADVPRILDALAECALAAGDAPRAIALSGSAAAIRRALQLDVAETMRAQLAYTLDRARSGMATPEATRYWMAGWRMPLEEIPAFALQRHPLAASGGSA